MKLGRSIVAGILCAAAGAGCQQPAAVVQGVDPAQARFEFASYEVDLGIASRPTVLTGFLLGGAVADLAVVTSDADEGRRVRLHAFEDGTWAPSLEATLGSDVLFVDVANIGGTDRLVSYEPGRLRWFDPEAATERELVKVTCSFDPPRQNEIPHVDITRDLNDDGRDDLVVPDVDGFQVFTQMESGAFADPVKVGTATDMSRILGADGYRYDPWSESRVHTIDYDHDDRTDLMFWSGDHFEVHRQDERGSFDPVAEVFTTDVAFDSDRHSTLTTGNMVGRVLHSVADLNGDSVADLVVYSLEGTSISTKRSRYEVHFGARAPRGGTAFAVEVGMELPSDDGRIQIGMDRHDFDGDGQVDLMVTTIAVKFLEGSVWKRIKGAMGDDVWLDLEFYRSVDGVHPAVPDTTRRIALDGPPSHTEPGWVPLDLVLRGGKHEKRRTQKSWPRAFNTTLRVGDVTGDGRSDLLITDHPRLMGISIGVPGPDLFAARSQEVAVVPPNDEEYTWLVDLNQDGKQDVLMHHPFTLKDAHGRRKRPPGTEPHQVRILISR